MRPAQPQDSMRPAMTTKRRFHNRIHRSSPASRASALRAWTVAAAGLVAAVAVASHAHAQAPRTAAPRTGAPALSATGGPAAAQTTAPITGYARGAVRTLPVSGTAGDHMETILAPGNAWVYGLEIGEKANQPCYIGLWAVEGSAPAPGFPTAFERCGGGVTETSIKTLGFEYARSSNAWEALRQHGAAVAIGLPVYTEVHAVAGLLALSNAHPPAPFVGESPVALDGVGICQRSNNDELKGLRAHGATLDTRGPRLKAAPIVTTEAQSVAGATIPAGARRNEQVTRPNCNAWREIQTCPADHILVGLDVHYKFPTVGNRERARITGLAPKCAPVTIRR